MASYSIVCPHEVIHDGKVIFEGNANRGDEFFMDAYKHCDMAYSRFHKMDEFCKLVTIAAEVILAEKAYNPEKTGVLLSSKTGSSYVDRQYFNNVFSSEKITYKPAQFTYTLPSTVLGQMCIRHNIRGENFFFIQEEPELLFLYNYAKSLFENQSYEA